VIPSTAIHFNNDGTEAWWVTGWLSVRSEQGRSVTIDRPCDTCGGFQSIQADVEGVSMGLRCPDCDGTGRHTFEITLPCPVGHPSTPCEEWGGVMHHGYGEAYNPETQGTMRAHRKVWAAANGPIPDGMVVMHLCDNPACVRLDHLRLGTRAENQADMRAKGRSANGTRLPHTKLTPEQVAEIRALDEPHTVTAARYGVADTVIGRIRRNKIWVTPTPCGCSNGVITHRVSVVPGMVLPMSSGKPNEPMWESGRQYVHLMGDKAFVITARGDGWTAFSVDEIITLPPDAKPGMWAVKLQVHQ
jgi:hypothetical protein